jgi:hypothetical protein
MMEDDSFQICHYDLEETVQFLEKNRNSTEHSVVFYICEIQTNYLTDILEYLDQQEEFLLRTFVVTFDFWLRSPKCYEDFTRKVFFAQNHYATTFAIDVNQLNRVHKEGFDSGKILFLNLWSVYRLSVLPFNPNPINKILLSGAINKNHYPERFLVSKIRSKVIAKYPYNQRDNHNCDNNYNQVLNRHLACFCSSVYIKPKNEHTYINTHVILQKVFEILAAGSLLVIPDTEIDYLANIGLVNRKHYFACRMSRFQEIARHITDRNNRTLINSIRMAGQRFAIDNLNSEQKYKQFKSLITAVPSNPLAK